MEVMLNQEVSLVHGSVTNIVHMREPTPRDLLNLGNIKQMELKEITLLSNLTSIDIESIKDMPMKDYKLLQKTLSMLQGDESFNPKP
ncbi:phage tail assembly protein [Thiotrichales bacterium 19S11-10]|nr:phage tail assembly protein [Thiotrichales bacterium 19S11-10]MCF6808524.1 phage tail assembly protein [Thiotrichales bacterium 19S9-11]MCF6812494.1 phage tail assembly protein [Thiotrichales bacterium 19S9-12]